MTRMMPAFRTARRASPRTLGSNVGTLGRGIRRALDLGAVTVEVFPPVVLVTGLALYFYMLACMGHQASPASP